MNNNSTPMNITGLKLVSTTPSSTLSKSPDFDFDLKRTDCGRVADKSDKDFDPQAPFSVAAQGSCTLWVYFHPNGLTAASATVQLLGNNLDGPTTFTLKGNAIGILVDSKEITPNKPPVACSHADKTACSIKLGNVSDSTATIPIFVISNDSAVVTPEQDGTQVKSSDQTALTCSPHTETDFAKGAAAACKIPLALDPAKGSTTLTLSNATSTLATYAVTYQTKAVDVKPDALSPTPQGSDVKVTGIVNEAGNSAVHVTDGTVTATVDGKSAGPPVSVGTDGRFSVDFGAVLPIGNHQIALSYESGKNSVYQSKIITVPVTITAPPDPPQPAFPAAGVTAGTSVSVILTLKTNGGVACNGKVTVAEQGATTPVSGDVTNGSATLTMAVKKGKQKETVTFTPTDTSCAQLPAADVSLIGH